ncbi:retrovirus-related pol polyprotein from transposon tnt 1-94 [Lasius niger]|uniref:Retrovirus-related pol polyprotein from transposon tnt 1-94 n=1 Tax=Lasius niger TaxID=67767 RepID=A0A0J7K7Q3_LASNI|nr:retrovirus-related pol polyprotein from transposon tnt 1-94 [Lasius niger]
MYLSVCTRPDISFAVSYLSQFNDCYGETHWKAAKHVLRYLKGTESTGLNFPKRHGPLTTYVDADWANCPLDRRSYTGFTFQIGRSLVSWESRKQRTVALSSTEAEYMALSEAAKEAICLRSSLIELGFEKMAQATFFCNSNGARMLAENPVHHNRSKHIDTKHHFVRDAVHRNKLTIKYVPTDEMAADALTKPLAGPKLKKCLHILGVE